MKKSRLQFIALITALVVLLAIVWLVYRGIKRPPAGPEAHRNPPHLTAPVANQAHSPAQAGSMSTTPFRAKSPIQSAAAPSQVLPSTTSNSPAREAVALPGPVMIQPLESVQSDLEMIRTVIGDYRNVLGENPVGSNAEITHALAGANPRHVSFLSSDSPVMNSNGELTDRWGTPYFFHQVSGRDMEIRSAGPDRRMWTGDDVQVR